MEGAFVDLLAAASAFGASFLLGTIKKAVGGADNAIVNFIKPVQPLVVGVAALGIPYLASAIGIAQVPDAATFVTAPTATVLAVTLREVTRRVFKQ
jgi:hypothetical protein